MEVNSPHNFFTLPEEVTNQIFSYLHGKDLLSVMRINSLQSIVIKAIDHNHVPLHEILPTSEKAIDFAIKFKLKKIDLLKFKILEIDRIISNCKNLSSLKLNECALGDDQLKIILEGSPNIQSLNFRRCLITGENFKSEKTYLGVITLQLYGCPVTDSGLENLLNYFPNVQTLVLGSTSITDKGLELIKASQLKVLNITSTSVTNKGVETLLNNLPLLQELFLTCCPNTTKEINYSSSVEILF